MSLRHIRDQRDLARSLDRRLQLPLMHGAGPRDTPRQNLTALRNEGLDLAGPVAADTAFTADSLREIDAVVAMYHDQGLPALKALGFGGIVNVTLGLPFIRTSVDHGTALHLAGSGKARPDSMLAAVACAIDLARRNAARQDSTARRRAAGGVNA